MNLVGRRKIYTATEEITEQNVISEVNNALAYHIENMLEIDYLYWYRRGEQPILNRKKDIRPEICNKCLVNNANQVVVFKNGYFLTKPAFYVSRKADEEVTNKVKNLNEFLYLSGKQEADNEVVNWFHTCGVGAIIVEPSKEENVPINVYALDPRCAFVVYSLRPGHKPIMAVNMVVTAENVLAFDVFTNDKVFKLRGTSFGIGANKTTSSAVPPSASAQSIIEVLRNEVGIIPIVEYQYNESRMGAFEQAISIMDAINLAESNRLDGIEQSIQQIIVAYNCNFEEGTTANTISKSGMVCLRSTNDSKADLKVITETLDQGQTQVTLDDLYEQMLEKCGVPSSVRDGGSTSDNVGAVYLRSGWASADTDARNTTDLFVSANRQFDKIFLHILKVKRMLDLNINDFELKVPRNDMSNLLVKTQAAMNMKELGLAPEIAFERSGLSNDALNDIEISRKYIDAKWNASEVVSTEEPTLEEEQTKEVKSAEEGGVGQL